MLRPIVYRYCLLRMKYGYFMQLFSSSKALKQAIIPLFQNVIIGYERLIRYSVYYLTATFFGLAG